MNRLRNDRRGATTVVFAASSVAMMALAGLVVDVGNIFSARRHLQGATDLAAVAAATNLGQALAAADANAAINAYGANDVSKVEVGVYSPDPSIPAGSRFQPSSLTGANAARVTMLHQQNLFFGGVFALAGGNTGPGQNSQAITTQGIAINENVADFSIGSRVAAFNGAIVNGVLSSAVGGTVNLSAIDYNNLAAANVDLFGLADALTAQAGQVSGTYKQALSGTVTLSNFLSALARVAPSAASALQGLAAQASLGNATVDLSHLLDYGPFANLSLSDPEPHITATASALSLIQAALELGGSSHLINLSIAPNIPGIAQVSGMMSMGEPAQGSTLLALDYSGTTVHTSQIRLFLKVQLLGTPVVPLVTVPLYVEVGYGTASLASLSCAALDQTTTSAALNVTPGLFNGLISNVTAAQMVNYSSEPVEAPAPLVSLGLVTVSGEAAAQMGNQTPVKLTFSYDDIQNKVVKSAYTTDFAGALLNGLVSNTQLQVNGVGALPGLQAIVMGILGGAVTPLDQLLDGVLQSAGVGVGGADTWINGSRCGVALLAG